VDAIQAKAKSASRGGTRLNTKTICVMTTIQPPGDCTRALAAKLASHGIPLLVVGDRKGPSEFRLPGTTFVPLSDQARLAFSLSRLLPLNHYSRKNLAYLLAMQSGAKCIYETDDDNTPAPNWTPRTLNVRSHQHAGAGWINVYRMFSDELLWPRGFPLSAVKDSAMPACSDSGADVRDKESPVQQGLVDGAADVDAVWRMLFHEPVQFKNRPSVLLGRGAWCPFNSQNTWWWPLAYPLLYLPSHCSFRMTDIWRSLIAQRCLWEFDSGVVFHSSDMIQNRNKHDLLHDFRDEVAGHLHNQQIASLLGALSLSGSMHDNLLSCYEALVREGILPANELDLVRAWLLDCSQLETL
jgi:hypothetical protein